MRRLANKLQLPKNKLDSVALLVADPPNTNYTTNSDTHLFIDLGDTLSILSLKLIHTFEKT